MKEQFKKDFAGRLVELHTGAQGIRTLLPVKATIPDDADGEPIIDMKASDETLDRYDEVIKADGWDLTSYKKNPVVQNSHQYWDIKFTLGKALRTEVIGGALVQRWLFAVDINPMAKLAYGLYRGGFLNASSVGFIPLEWINGNKVGEPYRTYTKSELLEVSAVAVPANPNALALAIKSGAIEGADIKELHKLLAEFCSKQAGSASNAGDTTGAAHVSHLLQLARSVADVARRA